MFLWLFFSFFRLVKFGGIGSCNGLHCLRCPGFCGMYNSTDLIDGLRQSDASTRSMHLKSIRQSRSTDICVEYQLMNTISGTTHHHHLRREIHNKTTGFARVEQKNTVYWLRSCRLFIAPTNWLTYISMLSLFTRYWCIWFTRCWNAVSLLRFYLCFYTIATYYLFNLAQSRSTVVHLFSQ